MTTIHPNEDPMDVAAVVLPDVPKRDTAYNGWKNRTTWNIMAVARQ